MKHLVLGGARSGKSRHAEQWAQQSGKQLIYVATAQAGDEEMAQRIAHHQQQRGDQWHLVESQLQLATCLSGLDNAKHCILVDCLTLWLSNALAANCWVSESDALLALLPGLSADLVLVSNEVGQGIVPLGADNRRFVDESGRLHQHLAMLCERVSFVTAGLPQILKA